MPPPLSRRLSDLGGPPSSSSSYLRPAASMLQQPLHQPLQQPLHQPLQAGLRLDRDAAQRKFKYVFKSLICMYYYV